MKSKNIECKKDKEKYEGRCRKKCEEDSERNVDKKGICRKKCKEDKERNSKTGRCHKSPKIKLSQSPKIKLSQSPKIKLSQSPKIKLSQSPKIKYGEFKSENRFINQFNNKEVVTPSGYYGLFVGRVYDSSNNLIHDADTYFWNLDKSSEKIIDLDSIGKDLRLHLDKKWHHIETVSSKYYYQAGFGGDEGDGSIDFFLEKKIVCPPDMKFKVYNKNYTMKFIYKHQDFTRSPKKQSPKRSRIRFNNTLKKI